MKSILILIVFTLAMQGIGGVRDNLDSLSPSSGIGSSKAKIKVFYHGTYLGLVLRAVFEKEGKFLPRILVDFTDHYPLAKRYGRMDVFRSDEIDGSSQEEIMKAMGQYVDFNQIVLAFEPEVLFEEPRYTDEKGNPRMASRMGPIPLSALTEESKVEMLTTLKEMGRLTDPLGWMRQEWSQWEKAWQEVFQDSDSQDQEETMAQAI